MKLKSHRFLLSPCETDRCSRGLEHLTRECSVTGPPKQRIGLSLIDDPGHIWQLNDRNNEEPKDGVIDAQLNPDGCLYNCSDESPVLSTVVPQMPPNAKPLGLGRSFFGGVALLWSLENEMIGCRQSGHGMDPADGQATDVVVAEHR